MNVQIVELKDITMNLAGRMESLLSQMRHGAINVVFIGKSIANIP